MSFSHQWSSEWQQVSSDLLDSSENFSLWVFLISLPAELSLWSHYSEFPQVSRTLLSILANIHNNAVCMVLIFNFSSLSSKPLETVPSALLSVGMTVIILFYILFLVLWQSPSICQSFHLLLLLLCGPFERQNLLVDKFFFHIMNWSDLLGLNWMIRLNLKILKVFKCFIL